jgi:hypothetical protein
LGDYPGPFLRSMELRNYEPAGSLKTKVTAPLPSDIQKLLGWPKQDSYPPGAYPLRP